MQLNIRDFGATGNGVDDDSPEWRAAMASLSMADGGDLCVAPWVYKTLYAHLDAGRHATYDVLLAAGALPDVPEGQDMMLDPHTDLVRRAWLSCPSWEPPRCPCWTATSTSSGCNAACAYAAGGRTLQLATLNRHHDGGQGK